MVNLLFALSLVLPLAIAASKVPPPGDGVPYVFKTPVFTPFLHMDTITTWPTNASTYDGVATRYPNLAGENLTAL